ncbi:pentapeptide repeat-containing protein [Nonomuraea sp. NPDC059194]|uniref:pentapeptide repeat-containing protein n=1 Tax=Nonomuraea sp. NPDC059194 TaxID=3346764 RepID=UPI0036B23375
MTEADLTGADLRGADLRGAKGLPTRAELAKIAKIDATTKLGEYTKAHEGPRGEWGQPRSSQ